MRKIISGSTLGLAAFVTLLCNTPAFCQSGAGMSTQVQVQQEVTAQQEELLVPCKGLIGQERAACMVRTSREMFRDAHPCLTSHSACKGLTGDAKAACAKKQSDACQAKREQRKEKFMDNHPCAQAAVEKPCEGLMIAERLECIKQKTAECRAQRKEIVKENHPCATPIVTQPCKDMTGMQRAKCIDQHIAACKAKWSGQ